MSEAARLAAERKRGSSFRPGRQLHRRQAVCLQRRREQVAAGARVEQPALFELKEDRRPIPERTAAGRYSEPSLFSLPGRGT